FRVFTLGESAFRGWEGEGDLESALAASVETLLPGREALAVVFALLQREGLPLTARVEEVVLQGHRFFDVASGTLLVSLEEAVSPAAWEAALARRPATLIAREAAFSGAEAERANLASAARRAGVGFRTV
ncbi:MAG: hypothetical protein ACLGIN_10245, partial [Candidatus Sericytochromatia bacterium]